MVGLIYDYSKDGEDLVAYRRGITQSVLVANLPVDGSFEISKVPNTTINDFMVDLREDLDGAGGPGLNYVVSAFSRGAGSLSDVFVSRRAA